jgi:hypothetical protein
MGRQTSTVVGQFDDLHYCRAEAQHRAIVIKDQGVGAIPDKKAEHVLIEMTRRFGQPGR